MKYPICFLRNLSLSAIVLAGAAALGAQDTAAFRNRRVEIIIKEPGKTTRRIERNDIIIPNIRIPEITIPEIQIPEVTIPQSGWTVYPPLSALNNGGIRRSRQLVNARPDTSGLPLNDNAREPFVASSDAFPFDTNIVVVYNGANMGDSAWVYKMIRTGRGPIVRMDETITDEPVFEREDEPFYDEGAVQFETFSSFMLGFNRLSEYHSPVNTELINAKSINAYVGIANVGMKLNWNGHVRLWTGIGADIDNYRYSDTRIRLQPGQAAFSPYIDSTQNSGDTRKSKLTATYLTIPLYIGFHSKESSEDGVNVLFGCQFGYRTHTHTKVVSENGAKMKGRDDFNLNDWKISPTVQIGYKGLRFYAKYNIEPFLREGQGPQTNLFTFGGVMVFS
jgi:hypothetical protein